MNEEQLAELVKGWPDEARPGDGWESNPTGYMVGGCYAPVPVAAALHVASGLEWLAQVEVIEIQFDHESDWLLCRWTNAKGVSALDGQYPAPTLIAAVSAAIMAVKGGAA